MFLHQLAISPFSDNYVTVIDNKKSSINVNRKSTMCLPIPMNHQPRSCVAPNFLEMGFTYPNLSFSHKFWKKH